MKLYCHLCGTKYTNESHPRICSACGNISYENARPTTEIVLFNDKNEVLLAKRGIEPNKGKYDLPGGFVELHETLESAIAREIEEELGLKPGDYTEPVFCVSWTADYPFSKEIIPTVNSVFVAKVLTTTISAKDDVESVEFVPVNEESLSAIDFSYKNYPEIILKSFNKLFN